LTTCIAAIVNPFWPSDTGPLVVVASDTKVSFSGLSSSQGIIKSQGFHRDWSALIAGNDISQSLPVVEAATELLRGRSGKAKIVRRGFKRAYAEYRREVMTDALLSSFDMTLAEFNRKGRKQMNPEIHADISFQIKNFDLGCTFLVYGFDDDGEPHIFTVSNPGKERVYDKPGFWAIGAGKTAAISMLAALGQHPHRNSMHETIYNVLAAKYISEGASDVGEETWLFIQKQGCSAIAHKPNMQEKVRVIWKEKGRPKTNEQAVEVIKESRIEFLPVPRGARALKRLALRKLKDQQ